MPKDMKEILRPTRTAHALSRLRKGSGPSPASSLIWFKLSLRLSGGITVRPLFTESFLPYAIRSLLQQYGTDPLTIHAASPTPLCGVPSTPL